MMSPLRRRLALLGLILLIASLVLLAASLWPAARSIDNQRISPEDLALPASQIVPAIFFLTVAGGGGGGGRRWLWGAGCAGLALCLLVVIAVGFLSLFTLRSASPPPAEGGVAEPTFEALPTFAPTQEVAPSPAPRPPEARAVELDYPLILRLGDSDVIRLALVIAPDGSYLTPTAESEGHTTTGEPVEIPNLYDTHTLVVVARLDSVGLNIDRPGDWEQPLLPGENVAWRWTISAAEPGRQRANLIIHLRFIPKAGGEMSQKELWARTLTLQATDVFGLPPVVAKGLGVFGSVIGAVLSFPFAEKFYGWLWGKIRRKPATA
ncbi:MAG: hypothetical protein AAB217_00335 [Chloroflexota bacterium]